MIKRFIPVPHAVVDTLLPTLREAELKVLLVIVRHTYGWKDWQTGGRRKQCWLTYDRLIKLTGLSRRVITDAISSLIKQNCIELSDERGRSLKQPSERKGRVRIFYACSKSLVQKASHPSADSDVVSVQNLHRIKERGKEVSKESDEENDLNSNECLRIGELLEKFKPNFLKR